MFSAPPLTRTIRLAGLSLAAIAALLFLLVLPGRAEAQVATKAGGRFATALQTSPLSGSDQKQRLPVGGRGRPLPLGGGMTADPPPSVQDGGGVYPHSY